MAIPSMLATLTDRRDFGEGWLLERKLDLGLRDDRRAPEVARERPR